MAEAMEALRVWANAVPARQAEVFTRGEMWQVHLQHGWRLTAIDADLRCAIESALDQWATEEFGDER